MSMTKSRRNVYARSWYKRESKINMRMRRKEYNRKIRYAKVTEDSCSKGYMKQRKCLECDTMS
jgi:hypothetical protein